MSKRNFDYILENGTIYDGSGKNCYKSDIGIIGDTIIETGDLRDAECKERINVNNFIVSPGFIDIHTHSDFTLIVDGNADSQLHQGVTTEVIGQCGHSVAPVRSKNEIPKRALGFEGSDQFTGWKSFGEYLSLLEQNDLGINVTAFVGHGTIHNAVMGDDLRLPDDSEIKEMVKLTEQSFEEGASGFSTGLEYWPGNQSSAEHILPLCEVTRKNNLLYSTHVRNRDRFYDLGFSEAISTARAAECRLQISHLQTKYGAPDHAIKHAIEMIDLGNKYGMDIAFDIIPHDWSHTLVMAILPKWAQEGGPEKIIKRLKESDVRVKIKNNRYPMWLLVADGIWDKIRILNSKENFDLVGETIKDIAEMRNCDPFDAVFDLIIEEGINMHQLMWTSNSFRVKDLEECIKHDKCAIMSDTLALSPEGKLKNKLGSLSGYGWTSEFLSYYTKRKNILPLSESIRRLTSLPAERLGIKDRGLIKKGFKADLTVMDYEKVESTWSIREPRKYPTGFEYVFVNGKPALSNGEKTKIFNGNIIKSPF